MRKKRTKGHFWFRHIFSWPRVTLMEIDKVRHRVRCPLNKYLLLWLRCYLLGWNFCLGGKMWLEWENKSTVFFQNLILDLNFWCINILVTLHNCLLGWACDIIHLEVCWSTYPSESLLNKMKIMKIDQGGTSLEKVQLQGWCLSGIICWGWKKYSKHTNWYG